MTANCPRITCVNQEILPKDDLVKYLKGVYSWNTVIN